MIQILNLRRTTLGFQINGYLETVDGDEGTRYYICSKCKEPCNFRSVKKND